uniref:Myb-like domain-containing protein n=1 Tax=Strongyloides papillosus TaxID=174720 RepID=A0A0N5C8U8_STREA
MDYNEDVVHRTLTYKDKRNDSDAVICFFCVEPINGDPYIKCKECTKREVNICVTCFQLGSENKEHKRGHNYCIVDTEGPVVFRCFRDEEEDDIWTWEEDKIVLEQAKRYRAGYWEGMPDHFHRTPLEAKNRFFTLFCKTSIGGLIEGEFEGIKFNDETGEIDFSKYFSGKLKRTKEEREIEVELLEEEGCEENDEEIDLRIRKKELFKKCDGLESLLKEKMTAKKDYSNIIDKMASVLEPYCEKNDLREFLMKDIDDYDEEKDNDFEYNEDEEEEDEECEYTDEEGTDNEYSDTDQLANGNEKTEDTKDVVGTGEVDIIEQPTPKRRRVSGDVKIILVENRQKNVKVKETRNVRNNNNGMEIDEECGHKGEVKTPSRCSPRKSSGSSSISQSSYPVQNEQVENNFKEEFSSLTSCSSSESRDIRRSQRLNRIPVPSKTAARCFLSTRPYFHLNNTTDVDQALTLHIKAEDAAVLKYHPYRDDFDMRYINDLEQRSYKYFSVVGEMTEDYESFAASDVNFYRCLRAWRRRIEVHSIIREHDLINKFIQRQTDEKIGRRKYIRNHRETIRGIFDEEKYEEYLHEFLSFCFQILSGPQFNNLCRLLARTEHIMDEIKTLEPLHESGVTELPHTAEEGDEEIPKKVKRKKKKRIVYQKSPNKARQWTFLQRMAKPLAGE